MSMRVPDPPETSEASSRSSLRPGGGGARGGVGASFPTRWHAAQIGARQYYVVPRVLHRRGLLARFYTDIWCKRGRGLLRRGPAAGRALAGRYHAGLRDAPVTGFNVTALRRRWDRGGSYDDYLRIGREFDEAVARRVTRSDPVAGRDAFFAFNTGCLATLRRLAERGVTAVVDQIDPAETESRIIEEEIRKYPRYAGKRVAIPEAYRQRLRDEWAAASHVLVNSGWSRDALVEQGVAAEKIMVVPMAYEPAGIGAAAKSGGGGGAPGDGGSGPGGGSSHAGEGDGGLRVLFLGQVNLRKGVPYLLEAAGRLPGVEFVIAGPVQIAEEIVRDSPDNVTFTGRITRDLTAGYYRSSDVFVLPTMSDGFAITQLEAMANGLPVIATERCGKVVDDGVDGLIVTAGDSDALTAAIERLDRDRDELSRMKAAAPGKARRFTADRWLDNLVAGLSAAE